MPNLIIIALGVFLIILGVILFLASLLRSRKIKGGGLILIGPFPIIFGEKASALVAMLLVVFLLTIFLVFLFSLGIIAGGWG